MTSPSSEPSSLSPLTKGVLFTTVGAGALTLGWLLMDDIIERTASEKGENSGLSNPYRTQSTASDKRTSEHPPTNRPQEFDSVPSFARPGERIVTFDSEKAYRKFLDSLSDSGVNLIGSIDNLRTARVSFSDPNDLASLVDEDSLDFNYLVSLPPGAVAADPGAVGFQNTALDWLGITEDNSTWGEGVTIAVIDSGVTNHPAINEEGIRRLDLTEDGTPQSGWNGHGTAVASLISGQTNLSPGVAPSADILDIRITDSEGSSDSFLLAEAITTAVDNNADVINISLGSYGDSSAVRTAVEYAETNGVVIVASSGNEGLEVPAFPAAYESVIAVGAVDATGDILNFSNTGETLDITAPGLEVFSAWTNDSYVAFSGTSASAPYVAGAIAATSSEFGITSEQAAEIVFNNSNEAGPEGEDLTFGSGHLDVGRAINSTTRGINDIATTSILIDTEGTPTVTAVVQNQGTEVIRNADLTIATPFASFPLNVPQLQPGATLSLQVPASLPQDEEFSVTAAASLPQSFSDTDPTNDENRSFFFLEPEI